ncbi:Sec-independent protein translocase protein TatB [Brevundimonas balnearis]|uniref:Sec-independent protein translocase protein TatB n=1 Tax=Brevundimonas balnearis TaxID=1572858 RepID=A0ABV6QYN5_9CAUL
MGPGIGGFEILVIGLVALIVVGPKDLPLLMRRVGQFMARARAMASEFRASFDEMARQSELDDLRKEVEALRRGQGMVPLGAEAEAAFRDIRSDLQRPLDAPQPLLTTPEGDVPPQPQPPAVAVADPEPAAAPAKPARRAGARQAKPRTPAKAGAKPRRSPAKS